MPPPRWHLVHWDAQEQVVGHLAAVAEHGDLAGGVELAYQLTRMPADSAFGEGDQ